VLRACRPQDQGHWGDCDLLTPQCTDDPSAAILNDRLTHRRAHGEDLRQTQERKTGGKDVVKRNRTMAVTAWSADADA